MRRLMLGLMLALSCFSSLGCQPTPTKPKPLSPDEERQLQEQLQKARAAEGATIPK